MLPATNRTCDGLARIASIIGVSCFLTASGMAADSPPPDSNTISQTGAQSTENVNKHKGHFPSPGSDAASQTRDHSIADANKKSEHLPPPGLGPGESVVFPANSKWPIIYRDQNGELGLTLPMSEGDWGTGDWFGLRHTLEDSGVSITGGYNSNILGNVVGGKKRGFTYADQIWLQTDLNMEKLVGWKGAHIVGSIIDRNGQQMSSRYTGNIFNPNQIWGQESFALFRLFVEQTLFNGWVNIKVGRMATTDDFLTSPFYGLYVNNGIDGQPNAICTSGWLTAWPYATWGGRIRIEDKKDHLYGMGGIYQITNRQYNPNAHGIDWSIRPYDGVSLIGEVGWTPEFQPHPQADDMSDKSNISSNPEPWHGMPGNYKFGGYYTFWKDIPTFDDRSAPGTWGLYVSFDQMVYQAKPGSDCGLTLWGVFLLAPDQRTAKIPYSIYTGAIYKGLIPGRSNDRLALMAIYGALSDVYGHSDGVPVAPDGERGVPTYEMVLEACYTIQLSKFWRVQPDVQYIIRPGGSGQIPNALVIGAQIGFNF